MFSSHRGVAALLLLASAAAFAAAYVIRDRTGANLELAPLFLGAALLLAAASTGRGRRC